ncbi:MAG: peroxiredoxin family protein [Candidatus Pacebacteria bacterium]|nr:peroxiredoxin family protein [Candidatus Paceibacterota bacterium]
MSKENIIPLLIFLAIGGLIVVLILVLQPKMNPQGNESQSNIRFQEAVGQIAPNFTLSDINDEKVTLSDLKGKIVVLFFSEGLRCYPACFDQVIKLSEDPRLNTDEIESFSVVLDSPKSWQSQKKNYPAISDTKILFDNGGNVSQKYNVLSLPSSMQKGLYPGHTYFVIDKDGIIRYTLDDPRMGLRNDLLAEEIEKLNEADNIQ